MLIKETENGATLHIETLAELRTLITTLTPYTVATLPDAALTPQQLIYVSDGASNQRLAVSDGMAWRFSDGNVVS